MRLYEHMSSYLFCGFGSLYALCSFIFFFSSTKVVEIRETNGTHERRIPQVYTYPLLELIVTLTKSPLSFIF